MKSHRPCLACGHENGLEVDSCTQCSQPLEAYGSAAGAPAVKRDLLGPGGQRRLAIILALLLVGAAVAILTTFSWTPRLAKDKHNWRNPSSVAAWAEQTLGDKGHSPVSVEASISTVGHSPRRLLVAVAGEGDDFNRFVKATAQILTEARAMGSRAFTHLAIVKKADGSLDIAIPVSEAARLARDEEACSAFTGIPLTLPDPVDEGEESAEPEEASESGESAEDGGTDAEAGEKAARAPERRAGVTLGPGRKVAGATPPARAGAAGLVLLRAKLSPDEPKAFLLDSIVVTAKGPGVEESLALIELVHDLDADGKRTAKDRLVGQPSGLDEEGRARFEDLDVGFGADGEAVEILVLGSLAPEIENGGSILLALEGEDAVSVEDAEAGVPAKVTGVGLTGTMIKLAP